MACTFTALILRGRQVHSVHVGDSRLYRLRDGSLLRQTTDHIPTRNIVIVLEEKVPVVLFSFADPTPWLLRAREAGAKVVCQVQSMEAARIAVAAGADVLAAQGNELGGHTGRQPLLPFLVRLVEEFPDARCRSRRIQMADRLRSGAAGRGRLGWNGLRCHR